MGFVARDGHGHVLASGAAKNHGTLSVSIVEALVFRWSLQVIMVLDYKHVQFETDSLIVYNAWRDSKGQNPYLTPLISDCRTLAENFSSFSFTHVHIYLISLYLLYLIFALSRLRAVPGLVGYFSI